MIFIALPPDAPLTREWFIAFAHVDFTTARLTRAIGVGDSVTTFGRGRV